MTGQHQPVSVCLFRLKVSVVSSSSGKLRKAAASMIGKGWRNERTMSIVVDEKRERQRSETHRVR